jgi:hypothetical protein
LKTRAAERQIRHRLDVDGGSADAADVVELAVADGAVALDLERERAVVQRLGQLAKGDFA